MENADIPILECMKKSYDGSHRGLADWYKPIEEGIREALKENNAPWTTGWYSSKHAIACARLTFTGTKVEVDVSVSDDFDTIGLASNACELGTGFILDAALQKIKETIWTTWEEAVENQRENRQYAMFTIHRRGHPQERRGAWIETYLINVAGLEEPPGDEYHTWGFQGETDELTEDEREEVEALIYQLYYSPSSPAIKALELTVGKWTVKKVE